MGRAVGRAQLRTKARTALTPAWSAATLLSLSILGRKPSYLSNHAYLITTTFFIIIFSEKCLLQAESCLFF